MRIREAYGRVEPALSEAEWAGICAFIISAYREAKDGKTTAQFR